MNVGYVTAFMPPRLADGIISKENFQQLRGPEIGRWHPIKRVMGPLFVVFPHPLHTDLRERSIEKTASFTSADTNKP